jgi:hypothetical protein
LNSKVSFISKLKTILINNYKITKIEEIVGIDPTYAKKLSLPKKLREELYDTEHKPRLAYAQSYFLADIHELLIQEGIALVLAKVS